MKPILVAVEVDGDVTAVWDDLADVATHVEWMADAESIRFIGDQRSGAGTTFDCVTRVGPIRLTDRMTITAWDPPHRMGVEHRGVVKGAGTFLLEPLPGSRTRFGWQETLTLPWWLGGRAGAVVVRPILTVIWRRNLRRFRERFSRRSPPPSPTDR